MRKNLKVPSLNPPLPPSPPITTKGFGAHELKSPKSRRDIYEVDQSALGSTDWYVERATAQTPASGASGTAVGTIVELEAGAAAAGDDTVFEVAGEEG